MDRGRLVEEEFPLIGARTLVRLRCAYIVMVQAKLPAFCAERQGVKSRRGIAFVGLAQIDELFAVANVDVSFYRLRHSTAIQVVEGSFFSLLLYVLHGRNDKATEELRSRPG